MLRRFQRWFFDRNVTRSARALNAPRTFRPLVEILEQRELLAAASVPGEILVQFSAGANAVSMSQARAKVGGVVQERLHSVAMQAGGQGALERLSLPENVSVDQAVKLLSKMPGVEFAERNWVQTHQAVSNDPYYVDGSLWGMHGDATSVPNQYGSQAGEAWASGATGSNNIYVGIIDEGIQWTHPDLVANVWTNPFDPADGIDNDGNGYKDDLHGWDFAGNNNTVYDGTSDDHGTHVAGTIAAKGGNGAGVAGVAWNVTYIPGKFLGPAGGTIANAVRALDYYTDLKIRHGLNIVATNNSWGGGGYSQALHQAIIRAAKQNILFIAAAGNGGWDGVGDNNNVSPFYPANYDTTATVGTELGAGYDAVISVAAIDKNGNLASFSNYGSTTVDIGAPGVAIWSTIPVNAYQGGNTADPSSVWSGTSMATPHVTGAAALYASTHPGATALDIKNAILSSAIFTPSLNGKTATNGRLNVGGFGVPPAPTLTIGDVSLFEGDVATTTDFVFTVTLANPSSTSATTVDYVVSDGSATTLGGDYLPVLAGTLTFAPGETTKTVTVTVIGDNDAEPDENFFVDLSNAVGATITDARAVGYVLDDDTPRLSITDETVNEGDGTITFTVTLSKASIEPVTVTFTTADGTAQAPGDYTASSGEVTFLSGDVTETITVSIVGDTMFETNETFFVNLSGASNAIIADSQGKGTITNDDARPTITIGDVTQVEGQSGYTDFVFTVSLSNASYQTITVDFGTANGSARSGSSKDYLATSGRLTFAPGATTATITVRVRGETTRESNETFFVNLTNAVNATILDGQGLGTIENDD